MSSPLALQLAESIRQEIATGSLSPGKPLPPERELVNRFQVSRGVVRMAIDLLSDEGLLIREPNCRPVVRADASRSAIDRTKADHINVWLWPSTSDFVASSVFRGVQDGLRGTDLRIVVGAPKQGSEWDEAVHQEVAFLEQVAKDEECAGVLIWAIGESEVLPALRKCEDARLPLVFIDREPPHGWVGDMVATDNFSSARQVAQYLRKLGHQSCIILTNRDGASSVRDRVNGFESGWTAEGGASGLPKLVYAPEAEADAQVYMDLARQVVDHPSRSTAVFAVNDSLALGLVGAFESLGVPVPQRVSVVGFDGLLKWLPGGGNLTSVHQDFRRMGELAIQLLLQRIAEQGDPSLPRRHLLLQAPLVLRETTAPPATQSARPQEGKEQSIR